MWLAQRWVTPRTVVCAVVMLALTFLNQHDWPAPGNTPLQRTEVRYPQQGAELTTVRPRQWNSAGGAHRQASPQRADGNNHTRRVSPRVTSSVPLLLPIVLVVPVSVRQACDQLPRLISFAVVRQTHPPVRVVLGVSNPTALPENIIACFEAAREAAAPVPVEWAVNLTRGSASASRNAALSVTSSDEAVAFHDMDDFMHPQVRSKQRRRTRTAHTCAAATGDGSCRSGPSGCMNTLWAAGDFVVAVLV
jgi:hypothetical protein